MVPNTLNSCQLEINIEKIGIQGTLKMPWRNGIKTEGYCGAKNF